MEFSASADGIDSDRPRAEFIARIGRVTIPFGKLEAE
jgi:hypothetical protein